MVDFHVTLCVVNKAGWHSFVLMVDNSNLQTMKSQESKTNYLSDIRFWLLLLCIGFIVISSIVRISLG